MKPHLLSLLLLIGIFSCSKPEPKTNDIEMNTINILSWTLDDLRFSIARYQRVFRDSVSSAAFKNAMFIHKQCDSTTTELIRMAKNANHKKNQTDSIQSIIDHFHQSIEKQRKYINRYIRNEDSVYLNKLANIKASTAETNTIQLLIYSITCLRILKFTNEPFCGILSDFDLETRVENNRLTLGDTLRCLTYFNVFDLHSLEDRKLFIEQPTLVKEIKCDDTIIKYPNLRSRFKNGYLEFIPHQKGNYAIIFSKTIELPNRKIETYESKVKFTVLP